MRFTAEDRNKQTNRTSMAKCSYCNSTIVIGGVRSGDQRYCNSQCQQNAYILGATKTIPADVLDRKVEEVWRGNCPKCGLVGPIDVHKFHEVWSALFLTRWTTKVQVSCRSCASKRQFGGIAFSLFFGWWGIPWGLVLTPVQIARNFIDINRGPDSSRPSDDLRKLVLVNLGTQMLASQKAGANLQRPPK
jgi:hypothetical protein